MAWTLLWFSSSEGNVLLHACYCFPLVKATCCFGAVFTNTAGEDNMLLLRDRWSRQRTFGNFLRIPPVRATYCCVSVFACTSGHGNVLLRDCFVCTTGEGNVFFA